MSTAQQITAGTMLQQQTNSFQCHLHHHHHHHYKSSAVVDMKNVVIHVAQLKHRMDEGGSVLEKNSGVNCSEQKLVCHKVKTWVTA